MRYKDFNYDIGNEGFISDAFKKLFGKNKKKVDLDANKIKISRQEMRSFHQSIAKDLKKDALNILKKVTNNHKEFFKNSPDFIKFSPYFDESINEYVESIGLYYYDLNAVVTPNGDGYARSLFRGEYGKLGEETIEIEEELIKETKPLIEKYFKENLLKKGVNVEVTFLGDWDDGDIGFWYDNIKITDNTEGTESEKRFVISESEHDAYIKSIEERLYSDISNIFNKVKSEHSEFFETSPNAVKLTNKNDWYDGEGISLFEFDMNEIVTPNGKNRARGMHNDPIESKYAKEYNEIMTSLINASKNLSNKYFSEWIKKGANVDVDYGGDWNEGPILIYIKNIYFVSGSTEALRDIVKKVAKKAADKAGIIPAGSININKNNIKGFHQATRVLLNYGQSRELINRSFKGIDIKKFGSKANLDAFMNSIKPAGKFHVAQGWLIFDLMETDTYKLKNDLSKEDWDNMYDAAEMVTKKANYTTIRIIKELFGSRGIELHPNPIGHLLSKNGTKSRLMFKLGKVKIEDGTFENSNDLVDRIRFTIGAESFDSDVTYEDEYTLEDTVESANSDYEFFEAIGIESEMIAIAETFGEIEDLNEMIAIESAGFESSIKDSDSSQAIVDEILNRMDQDPILKLAKDKELIEVKVNPNSKRKVSINFKEIKEIEKILTPEDIQKYGGSTYQFLLKLSDTFNKNIMWNMKEIEETAKSGGNNLDTEAVESLKGRGYYIYKGIESLDDLIEEMIMMENGLEDFDEFKDSAKAWIKKAIAVIMDFLSKDKVVYFFQVRNFQDIQKRVRGLSEYNMDDYDLYVLSKLATLFSDLNKSKSYYYRKLKKMDFNDPSEIKIDLRGLRSVSEKVKKLVEDIDNIYNIWKDKYQRNPNRNSKKGTLNTVKSTILKMKFEYIDVRQNFLELEKKIEKGALSKSDEEALRAFLTLSKSMQSAYLKGATKAMKMIRKMLYDPQKKPSNEGVEIELCCNGVTVGIYGLESAASDQFKSLVKIAAIFTLGTTVIPLTLKALWNQTPWGKKKLEEKVRQEAEAQEKAKRDAENKLRAEKDLEETNEVYKEIAGRARKDIVKVSQAVHEMMPKMPEFKKFVDELEEKSKNDKYVQNFKSDILWFCSDDDYIEDYGDAISAFNFSQEVYLIEEWKNLRETLLREFNKQSSKIYCKPGYRWEFVEPFDDESCFWCVLEKAYSEGTESKYDPHPLYKGIMDKAEADITKIAKKVAEDILKTPEYKEFKEEVERKAKEDNFLRKHMNEVLKINGNYVESTYTSIELISYDEEVYYMDSWDKLESAIVRELNKYADKVFCRPGYKWVFDKPADDQPQFTSYIKKVSGGNESVDDIYTESIDSIISFESLERPSMLDALKVIKNGIISFIKPLTPSGRREALKKKEEEQAELAKAREKEAEKLRKREESIKYYKEYAQKALPIAKKEAEKILKTLPKTPEYKALLKEAKEYGEKEGYDALDSVYFFVDGNEYDSICLIGYDQDMFSFDALYKVEDVLIKMLRKIADKIPHPDGFHWDFCSPYDDEACIWMDLYPEGEYAGNESIESGLEYSRDEFKSIYGAFKSLKTSALPIVDKISNEVLKDVINSKEYKKLIEINKGFKFEIGDIYDKGDIGSADRFEVFEMTDTISGIEMSSNVEAFVKLVKSKFRDKISSIPVKDGFKWDIVIHYDEVSAFYCQLYPSNFEGTEGILDSIKQKWNNKGTEDEDLTKGDILKFLAMVAGTVGLYIWARKSSKKEQEELLKRKAERQRKQIESDLKTYGTDLPKEIRNYVDGACSSAAKEIINNAKNNNSVKLIAKTLSKAGDGFFIENVSDLTEDSVGYVVSIPYINEDKYPKLSVAYSKVNDMIVDTIQRHISKIKVPDDRFTLIVEVDENNCYIVRYVLKEDVSYTSVGNGTEGILDTIKQKWKDGIEKQKVRREKERKEREEAYKNKQKANNSSKIVKTLPSTTSLNKLQSDCIKVVKSIYDEVKSNVSKAKLNFIELEPFDKDEAVNILDDYGDYQLEFHFLYYATPKWTKDNHDEVFEQEEKLWDIIESAINKYKDRFGVPIEYHGVDGNLSWGITDGYIRVSEDSASESQIVQAIYDEFGTEGITSIIKRITSSK